MTAYASSIKLEENDEDANDAVGWKPFDKPSSSSAPAHVSTPAAWRSDFDIDMPEHASEVSLVDEGDMVPNVDFQMDVTFDDEGLNTLERIFLLSKSEYPFHRAYVSRVLGDLLNDVDPCESVEYVLPLLSGFSEDDDESVKEAFASELQRILWYFYSTCRLVEEDTEAIGGVEYEPKRETMTVTSEGMQVVPKPSADEAVTATENTVKRRASLLSLGTTGQSSTDSSLSHAPSFPFSLVGEEGGDTPNSTVSDAPSSQSTAFSPGLFIMPHTDDGDPETVAAKNDGPLVDRPTLAIGFFTPLLGSLLLNDNPGISDAVRLGVVHLIGRLRGTGELSPEVWGRNVDKADADERRIFISQNGPHAHDLRPFTVDAMTMVEIELLQGIIIGMGKLSTEVPESLFVNSLEDGQRALEHYAEHHRGEVESGDLSMSSEAEAFKFQLIQEATAGRATSMNLIGAVCELYSGEEAVERGFIDEVLRSKDGDVPVRAEAAVALSSLAKIAPVQHICEMVSLLVSFTKWTDKSQLPLFEQFMTDEFDLVRQSVCLSLPALCRRIESPHREW